MARVHRRQSAQKRRMKSGPSVAYQTTGPVLSQNMGHEDASGQATDGCNAVVLQRYARRRRSAVSTGPANRPISEFQATIWETVTPPPAPGTVSTGHSAIPCSERIIRGGGGGGDSAGPRTPTTPPPPKGPPANS